MLCLFIVMIPTIYLFRKIKKFVSELSNIRQFHDKKTMFIITQTFSGIKDLLVVNKSKIFTEKYNENISLSSKANSKNSFAVLLPRNILELFLIFGIGLIAFYIPMESNNYKSELLKIMAAFAIVSFRIMPALTRIVVSINTMSFMFPVLQGYYKLVSKLEKSEKNQ